LRYARIALAIATTTATAVLVVTSVFAADAQPQDPDTVPVAVTIDRVITGAGSGEVELTWQATPDATGYRVFRSGAANGQFTVAAEIDITTGTVTAAADVVSIFSDSHTYIPERGPLRGPDPASQFTYVDIGPRQRCFAVVAFNAAGRGPLSRVACAAPPGAESEPATPVPGEPTFTA
jgi:hypothetical protein